MKDNQPGLGVDIRARFGFEDAARQIAAPLPPEDSPPPSPQRTVRDADKGHGRLEVRTLRTTSILTCHEQWKDLAQGFEIIRERTIKGIKTVEVGYG